MSLFGPAGAGNYIGFSSADDLQFKDVTVSVWFKLTTLGSNRYPVNLKESGDALGYWIRSNTDLWRWLEDWSTAEKRIEADTSFGTGSWINLIMTATPSAAGNTSLIYFDNSSIGLTNPTSGSGIRPDTLGPWNMGGSDSQGTIDGLMSDVGVWNRVITSGERATLQTDSPFSIPSGLVFAPTFQVSYEDLISVQTGAAFGAGMAIDADNPTLANRPNESSGPALTNPTDVADNPTAATGTVVTDTGDGSMYAIVSLASVGAPSVAQMQLGQDGDSNPAPWADNRVIVTPGLNTFNATGLFSNTNYVFYFQQRNFIGEDSTVAAADGFTTPIVLDGAVIYDGSVIPSDSILHYQTGEQDGGDGQVTFSDSSLSMTVNEYVDLIVENRTDGSRGVVISNTATDIVATLAGGTDNDWDNLDEMHVVADITTDDIIHSEVHVGATSSEVPIQWNIEASGGGFSATYTQIIQVAIGFPGTYEVILSPDGTVFLDAAMPGLSNAQFSNVQDTTANGSVDTTKNTGTLFYLATQSASALPDTIKSLGDTKGVTVAGQQNVSVSNLAPDSLYFIHFLHENEFGDSNNIRTGEFNTAPVSPGGLPPVLSTPTAVGSSTTTADGTVFTNAGDGTLYWLASVNAVESIANIKLGDSVAITAPGTKLVSVTGLTSGTDYYMHYVHENPDGDSNVVVAPFETEFSVAILSNPTQPLAPFNTLTASIDTDTGGGVLYYLVDTNATALAAAIKAGRSKVVTAVGAQNITWSGLNTFTQYYVHYIQTTSGDSNIINSLPVTTGDVIPVPLTSTLNDAILIVTGGPTVNDGLAIWYNMQMNESLRDAEYRFLIENGATPRTLNDMWFQLLTPTYGPGALNDMQLAYWLAGGVF